MESPLEQRLRGAWRQLRGRIQETWGTLTDEDLERAEGRLDRLIGTIQERTGKSRAEIERKLDQMSR